MNIVLLPGLDGTGDLFGPFVVETPENWSTRVVSYPTDQCHSYAECVALVRDQLPGGKDYLLLGESFSGPVAITLAAEGHPGLKGLVLCNTFVRSPWWRPFGRLPWTRIFDRPIPSIVMAHMGANKAETELRALMRSATSSVQPEVLGHRLRQVLSVDCTQSLLAVKVPILYLRGRFDTTVRDGAVKHIRSLRPDIVMSEHPVAHLLLQLMPQLAWEAIDSFHSQTE